MSFRDWFFPSEIRSRDINIARQAEDIRAVKEDIRRINIDIDKEIELKAISEINRKNISNNKTINCFYCGENISASSKICPECKRVFVEYAEEVFLKDKSLMEGKNGN